MTSEHDLSRMSRDRVNVEDGKEVCSERERGDLPPPGRFMGKGIPGVTYRTLPTYIYTV